MFIIKFVVRRIILTADKITYCNPGSDTPVDFFPLRANSTAKQCNIESKEYAFVVNSGHEEIVFNAANDEDREEWMDALLTAIKRNVLLYAKNTMSMSKSSNDTNGTETSAVKVPDAEENIKKLQEKAALISEAKLNAEALLIKEQEEAALAVENKKKLHAKIETPTSTQKKWRSENTYTNRYVWIDTQTFELHWSKSATSKGSPSGSKSINIKNHIKRIHLNSLDGVKEPNLVIELVLEDVPSNVFGSNKLFSKKSGKDNELILINSDSELIEGYYKFIMENKLR